MPSRKICWWRMNISEKTPIKNDKISILKTSWPPHANLTAVSVGPPKCAAPLVPPFTVANWVGANNGVGANVFGAAAIVWWNPFVFRKAPAVAAAKPLRSQNSAILDGGAEWPTKCAAVSGEYKWANWNRVRIFKYFINFHSPDL